MATVLITGANRGIGLAMAKQYRERGDEVFIAARTPDPSLNDIAHRVFALDVCKQETIDAVGAALAGTRVDILINNAGLLERNTLNSLDVESVRRQFEVNSLGPLRVTAGLQHCLGQGSKVGIVSSRMGSLTDNTSGSHYGYRMSKAAVNMVGRSLAVDLAPKGIAVRLLHPGYVKTKMTGFNGNWGPDEAAEGLLARLDELTLSNTGEFWHASGEKLPW